MKERFEGEDKRSNLIRELKKQKITGGDEKISSALASKLEITELESGEVLIKEGASDDDMFFILVGGFSISVKGNFIASRTVGDHVGEISVVNPSIPRSATVTALEKSVLARISSKDFVEVANQYPTIWKSVTEELAHRLYQRNNLLKRPNQQPKLFIISSKEALNIAQEIQSILKNDFMVKIWTDGTFFASSYALEALEEEIQRFDFAAAIAQPDDKLLARQQEHIVPRDNVIFELGLFIGHLGRKRTFLLQPDEKKLKLPSDLNGLIAINYKSGEDNELTSLISPVCNDIRKIIKQLGVKTHNL